MAFGRDWMKRKKIDLNAKDDQGNPITKRVTVEAFIGMFNDKNKMLNETTKICQSALGHLYHENPENRFFKSCGDELYTYAQNKSKELYPLPSPPKPPEGPPLRLVKNGKQVEDKK